MSCSTYYSGNATIRDKDVLLLDRFAASSAADMEPKKRVCVDNFSVANNRIIPPPVTCNLKTRHALKLSVCGVLGGGGVEVRACIYVYVQAHGQACAHPVCIRHACSAAVSTISIMQHTPQ